MFENNLSAETYSGIMPLLSVNKVAETLGLGRSTVYQLISRGNFRQPALDVRSGCARKIWRSSLRPR